MKKSAAKFPRKLYPAQGAAVSLQCGNTISTPADMAISTTELSQKVGTKLVSYQPSVIGSKPI